MFGLKKTFEIFLNVTSTEVTVALVICQGGVHHVVWHHTEHFSVFRSVSDDAIIQQLSSAISKAGVALESRGMKLFAKHTAPLTACYVTLHAPCCYTLVSHFKTNYREKVTFDEEMLDKLNDAASRDMASRIEQEPFKNTLHIKAVQEELLQVELNGYPVKDPIGKEARNARLKKLITLADSRIFESVITFHKKYVPATTLHIVSGAFVVEEFVRNSLQLPETLILDVSGEMTEISVVHKGTLEKSSFSSIGVYDFARSLAVKKDRISSEESLRALQENDESLEVFCGKRAIDSSVCFSEAYTKLKENILESLKDTIPPSTVFLRTEPGYESFFKLIFTDVLKECNILDPRFHVFHKKLFRNNNISNAQTNISVHVFHTAEENSLQSF